MSSPTQKTGYQLESQALRFLRQQGLHYVCKNYRCAHGEIDLIMKQKDVLVFVEVRLRNNLYYATAIESITPAKQKKMIKTALHYLQQQQLLDKVTCRFDVIGQNQDQRFYWIKDALEVQY